MKISGIIFLLLIIFHEEPALKFTAQSEQIGGLRPHTNQTPLKMEGLTCLLWPFALESGSREITGEK